jgi:hypothetical protein
MAIDAKVRIRWIDRECESQCLPDPAYPNGIDIDMACGKHRTCTIGLPYPAKRCGVYIVDCRCGHQIAVITNGRVDDPRSLTLACKNGLCHADSK